MKAIETDKIIARCNQEQIGADYSLLTWGEYIAFYGVKLFVFKTNGELVIHRKDLRNIEKVTFIFEDRILLACASQKKYIVLSLIDGSECWNSPYPKVDMLKMNFVKSPDGSYVYDYGNRRGNYYFIKIDLQNGTTESFALEKGLRCICDMVCDENGFPCLLECHYETIAEREVSLNGVRYLYRDEFDPGSACFWKAKWEMEHPRIAKFFLEDAQLVLTEDLFVCDLRNGTSYHLLENEGNWEAPIYPVLCCWVDANRRYVVLVYDDATIFVDFKTRKMVARYQAVSPGDCIIGNDFWTCTKEGVKIKPFPSIEDITPKKNAFGFL
ncbi:MAG: hypothetical protein E7454_04535 [Ruminococcaceae bacterium]|nr:hypothetical protein [Oscillospiraceae bacterium]